jgi:hypothetical protein
VLFCGQALVRAHHKEKRRGGQRKEFKSSAQIRGEEFDLVEEPDCEEFGYEEKVAKTI